MRIIQLFIQFVHRLNLILGRSIAWLTGAMALVVFGIVITRALFDINSIAVQESVTYMHALVFLLCLGYTAQEGGHVRVDIFYRQFSPLGQAWVNAIGALIFLLPFSIFILWISWQFTLDAWEIREASNNPGGIPAIYLLKTLVPLAGAILFLRGLAEVLDKLLTLTLVEHSPIDKK